MPADVSVGDGFSIAAATGRLRTFDFSFDLTNPYTFWSGTIAALFLFCSYFGTDQSQVQRYLTARSVDEARHSLLMSAYWKIPLQVLVLLLGVLVFVFDVFNQPPLLFNPAHVERVQTGDTLPAFQELQSAVRRCVSGQARGGHRSRGRARHAGDPAAIAVGDDAMREQEAAVQSVRAQGGRPRPRDRRPHASNDVNYIIPRFILDAAPGRSHRSAHRRDHPRGTDTIAGELNSLSTATVIDFYKRRVRPTATDDHYLAVSKIATGLWGVFACGVAVWAAELGSLIEVVNRFGSFFYGSILGVFILAVAFPRATGNGAFIGLLAGMASVAWVASSTPVAFLWHNVVGAVVVVLVGLTVSLIDRRPPGQPDTASQKSTP